MANATSMPALRVCREALHVLGRVAPTLAQAPAAYAARTHGLGYFVQVRVQACML